MNWAIASFAIVAAAIGGWLLLWERSMPKPRSIALVASLSALAVAGRLAFAPLPNVKPTTDIVLIAGFALGASPGFAVGAVTALVSNMAFGQGPWTPWQMLAWGLVGLVGAGLARVTSGRIDRVGLAVVGAICGFLFGTVMDVSQWLLYSGRQSSGTLLAYMATSLPWNVAHAAGNVAFALAFGPALLAAIRRATSRMEPEWLPSGTPLTALALPVFAALATFAPTVSPVQVRANSAGAGSVQWLVSQQRIDGSFGGEMENAWASLALASAGKDLALVAREGGLSAMERLTIDAAAAHDAAAQERLALAVAAAGGDPTSVGGRNLISEIDSQIGRDGSVGGKVNLTAFAILAMRAGGRSTSSPAIRKAGGWLAAQQQSDGGFSFAARGAAGSDSDDTAGALQGLEAADLLGGRAADRAVAYLKTTRSAHGGFSTTPGGQPNAQSTAWVIQGLDVAAGGGGMISPAKAWLRSLALPSGQIAYAPGQSISGVWVTAQALLALSGRELKQRAETISTPSADSGPASGESGSAGAVGASAVAKTSAASHPAHRRPRHPDAQGRRLEQAHRVVFAGAVMAGRVVGVLVRAFTGAKR
jgi:energy-coupling factor transport system substrate-specific component